MYYFYSCARYLIGDTADVLYVDPPAEVYESVYIGSLASVRYMESGTIVNVSGVKSRSDYDFPFDDVTLTPENLQKNIAAAELAARTLAAVSGKRLVNCAAGVNRSAFVIGIYLIRRGFSYEDTVCLLTAAAKKRRVPTLTNNSFRMYLKHLSDQLKSSQ